MRTPVFEIAWVKLENEAVQVAGRAYETIRVGDRLDACTSDGVDADCAAFLVLKIKMYNRDIEQIDPIFAGLLILEGTDQEILEKSHYLFASDL